MSHVKKIAGIGAHSEDPPLPSWPYGQNDARVVPAPDAVWAPWEKARPPLIYHPPQFQYGPCSAIQVSCCYYHRGCPPCGCDMCSCCGIDFLNFCCLLPLGNKKYVQITDPDEWFAEMLHAPSDPDCPDYLRGVFWMQDNPGSEVVCTFQHCAWVSNRVAFQDTRYNYTHDATNIGGFAGAAYQLMKYMTRIEVPPHDGPWINIGGYSWMYRVQPGDEFFDADHEPVQISVGDFMRISYLDQNLDPAYDADDDESQHTMMFQYLVRKIAYLDESGEVCYTAAYDELAERARGPFKKSCCGEYCCGFFSLDEVPESDYQTVAISTADPELYEVDDLDEEAVGHHNLDMMDSYHSLDGMRMSYTPAQQEMAM